MTAAATPWTEVEAPEPEGPVAIDETWLEPIEESEAPRPGGPGASGMLSAEPGIHAWEAHLAAVTGVALDPVHLYLRSTLPREELGLPEAEACAAAVLKARCDHQFWKPLVPAGLDGSFHGHFKDFHRCRELLEAHPAPEGCEGLRAAREQALREIVAAFPPDRR